MRVKEVHWSGGLDHSLLTGGIGGNDLDLWLPLLSGWCDGSRLLLRHHLNWVLGHSLGLGHRQRHGGVGGHRLSSLGVGSGHLLWDLLLHQWLLGNCSSISDWQGLSSAGDLLSLGSDNWLLCLYGWIRERRLRRGGRHLGRYCKLLKDGRLGDWLLGNGRLCETIRGEIGLLLLARSRLINGLGWLCCSWGHGSLLLGSL